MNTLVHRLYQRDSWLDGEGKRWVLEELTPHHRKNLMAYLRRKAPRLQLIAMLEFAATDPPDEIMGEFEMPPELWVEQLPIMRRLKEIDSTAKQEPNWLTKLRNKWWRLWH